MLKSKIFTPHPLDENILHKCSCRSRCVSGDEKRPYGPQNL